jgi:S-adenosylmethionine:tRNA ribosyltransferase-isomerase
MLLIDPQAGWADAEASMLANLLRPGDVLTVNDAATIPASLMARSEAGEAIEIRLVDAPYTPTTRAVLFGAGDYHIKTEERPPPPILEVGSRLRVGVFELFVVARSPLSPRLIELGWPHTAAEQRFRALYEQGRPVQYSYVDAPLALWDVQTSFAARPWAVEMPSAAGPLDGALLVALRERGVKIATLTHAAGLSATGDQVLDAALPFAEPYEIPEATAQLIAESVADERRVVAVGTSVVRALEDSAQRHGFVRAGRELATLVLNARHRVRVVSGMLTGVHLPGESHYRLLEAFVDGNLLAQAARYAERANYRPHEIGDACLVLPGILQPDARLQATGEGTLARGASLCGLVTSRPSSISKTRSLAPE